MKVNLPTQLKSKLVGALSKTAAIGPHPVKVAVKGEQTPARAVNGDQASPAKSHAPSQKLVAAKVAPGPVPSQKIVAPKVAAK